MFKQLKYKDKFKLLIAFSLIMGLITYQYAISKTVAVYKSSKDLDQKISEAASAPAKASNLIRKLSQLDGLLQSRQFDTATNVHDLLLGYVSKYCKEKKVILKSFPETNSLNQGEFEVETNIFGLEGNFINILKLVYLVEQKERIGKISSLNFQSVRDLNSRETFLSATVYLQSIKKIKS